MPYEEVERLVRKEPIEDFYVIGQELGRGKFAIVKKCTEKSTGNNYAAKYLRKRRGGKACRSDIIVEIDVMRQSMPHHRIVKLHEVFESQREMIIIIELATGGELFRMIAVDPLPEEKAKYVVWELLEGVQHLHAMNIVHLDLKPENILLYRKGQLDIKIADFGLAMQITPGQQIRTLVGTAEYVAPEILNFEPIDITADLWSIGALTYALLTGYSPFQGETHSHTFYNVSMCEYDFEDEVFDDVSQEAKDFIEELLQKKPSERISASKCLQHPWMRSCNPTPLVQNPQTQTQTQTQTQNHEGLNSSTSSLDSALWIDTPSSQEQSPSSSASSSFAPRPTGKGGSEEELTTQHEDISKQLKEKVSKLCTEMQKAELESTEGIIHTPLDGSASSISSNDSGHTLKGEEEDGGVFIPSSIQPSTPSPPPVDTDNHVKRTPSSSDEGRSFSRPTSALRVTTPIQGDVVSLAPETIEKLKKLERLKQRKREEKAALENEKLLEQPRKTSLPVSSNDTSTKPNNRKLSSPFPSTRPRPKSPQLSELLENEPDNTPHSEDRSEKVPFVNDVKRTKTTVSNVSVSPNSEKKMSDRSVSSVKENTRSPSPQPIKNSVTLTSSRYDRSPSPKSMTNQSLKKTPEMVELSTSPSSKNTRSTSPTSIAFRVKSYSPQPMVENFGTRVTKSNSPVTKSSSTNRSGVMLRNKGAKKETRASWRETPHIDPDAITALLNLGKEDDIDDEVEPSLNKTLETCIEEKEPHSHSPGSGKNSPYMVKKEPRSHSPGSGKDSPYIPKKTDKTDGGNHQERNTPILKKGGISEPNIHRKDSPKRVIIIEESNNRTRHDSHDGSPLSTRSESRDSSPVKHAKLLLLQKSMTMSRSTPDLTALMGTSKSRKLVSREESYVTGGHSSHKDISSSRTSGLRNSLFGRPITRSMTISGRSNKRSPVHIRDKNKLRN